MAKDKKKKTGKEPGGLFGANETSRKMLILISMILTGILLIAYRSSYEYWRDMFSVYNQILFVLSLLLFMLILVVVITNFKNIIKHELIGTVIFLVGAIILLFVPARNLIGLGNASGTISILYIIGGIVVMIGTIFLMRTGGYIGVCLLSLLLLIIVSANYMLINKSAVQYNSNTYLITNYAIIFLILCFILVIYNDLKFFYLVKLIRDEQKFRKNKEYNKAMSYCNRALLIYPYFTTAWNNKGNIYLNMGKKKDALDCYKKALSINENYEPAKKNLKFV